MKYLDGLKKIYILNDGLVAEKENYKEIENLAMELKVKCITRQKAGGAKAGNINNALMQTKGDLVLILDADHVPHSDFLEKTVGFFADPKMAFVQVPQYYKNYKKNFITRGAWEQQELFFGPICKGKNRLNSATMCGTNMLISKKALEEVGGMVTESIAEDFVTGLLIHQKGYKSVYVPKVLSEGLAPEDFLSYYKQQFRWARGAFDVLFKYNPLFMSKLTWSQRIQYLSSSSFYLSGLVVVMNACLPLIFFAFGLIPFKVSTMILAAVFIPYIFVIVYTLRLSSNFAFTFRSLAFSLCCFPIHVKAFWAALTGTQNTFQVTSKEALEGNFTRLVMPHIIYIILFLLTLIWATIREGTSASVINNAAWAFLYSVIFLQFIIAATPLSKIK